MSIGCAIREGDHFWVATNSTMARDRINVPNEYAPTMPLFKVNDILVCFHGNHALDDALLLKLDWASIKGPLTERSLYKGFFRPMVALPECNSFVSKEDDGSVSSFPSSFLFLGPKDGFSFRGDALRKINEFATIGTAEEPASGAFDYYYGKIPPAELAIEMVRGGIRFSADTTYPILLASSDNDEMTVIEEDGSRRKMSIPRWEKGKRQ
jgi:hypothetical protein